MSLSRWVASQMEAALADIQQMWDDCDGEPSEELLNEALNFIINHLQELIYLLSEV